jgi:hypothetical protein
LSLRPAASFNFSLPPCVITGSPPLTGGALVYGGARRAPFSKRLARADTRGVVFVRPELVAKVEYGGGTNDRLVRHAGTEPTCGALRHGDGRAGTAELGERLDLGFDFWITFHRPAMRAPRSRAIGAM